MALPQVFKDRQTDVGQGEAMEMGKISFLPEEAARNTYIKVHVMKGMGFNAWLFGQFQMFQKFTVVTNVPPVRGQIFHTDMK